MKQNETNETKMRLKMKQNEEHKGSMQIPITRLRFDGVPQFMLWLSELDG